MYNIYNIYNIIYILRTKSCALKSTQPLKLSTRDFSWGKGGRCVWLTTYHPCSAESREDPGALTYPEPRGPPRPVAGYLYFTLLYRSSTIAGDWAYGWQAHLVEPKLFWNPKKIPGGLYPNTGRNTVGERFPHCVLAATKPSWGRWIYDYPFESSIYASLGILVIELYDICYGFLLINCYWQRGLCGLILMIKIKIKHILVK